MAGGLSYASGRDMPPGMQMLLADQTVQRLRNATAAAISTPEMQEAIAAAVAVAMKVSYGKCNSIEAVPFMTNGEKIRSMSDEELAEKLFLICRMAWERDEDISNNWCDMKGDCCGPGGEELDCSEEKHKDCILRWLQAPAKESSL